MRFTFVIVAAAALLSATASASDVISLNSQSFNAAAKREPLMLVKFVSSWCAHCIELVPAFDKAAASLKGVAQLATVDCSDHTQFEFCRTIGVMSFPTLRVYRHGAFAAYPGPLTADGIVSALKASAPRYVCTVSQLFRAH
ncbi:thioredoxin-like protein [Fomitopsis serialis]|uniref:thioredoxin-like protein n=1 Tax=Fomitopsis serialis TaxID=139415 RepID=UPI0020072B14|nr:thioredoxin-like protein [Neoantrodia serialis]KAH9918311.1 thioredoxin-like protein [Neoantrodia serialis]